MHSTDMKFVNLYILARVINFIESYININFIGTISFRFQLRDITTILYICFCYLKYIKLQYFIINIHV